VAAGRRPVARGCPGTAGCRDPYRLSPRAALRAPRIPRRDETGSLSPHGEIKGWVCCCAYRVTCAARFSNSGAPQPPSEGTIGCKTANRRIWNEHLPQNVGRIELVCNYGEYTCPTHFNTRWNDIATCSGGGTSYSNEPSPPSTEPIRSDRLKWPSASVQKNEALKNGPRRQSHRAQAKRRAQLDHVPCPSGVWASPPEREASCPR
jgi:hypothetical protein